jgi:uncharacterized membrane protein YphA (DoxX/SURF4 family)
MPINPIAIFVTIPVVLLTVSFVQVVRTQSVEQGKQLDFIEIGRAKKIGYRISTIALASLYIMTGVPKLTGLFDLIHRFEQWGYSQEFMYLVGATEFLAGLGLLIPISSTYSAIYLSVIMTGAVYTHLAFAEYQMLLLPLLCLSFLAFIIYEDFAESKD